MLSPLDDLPLHQAPLPARQPATSDRNFYDRYDVNCHPCSDELFLVIGQGQYPNLGVQDAFALVRRGNEHRVVRASRELGLDRLDTTVGPFAIEVVEGLKVLRCSSTPPSTGWPTTSPGPGSSPPSRSPRTSTTTPTAGPSSTPAGWPSSGRGAAGWRSTETATRSPPTGGGGAGIAPGGSVPSGTPSRPGTWPASRPPGSGGSTPRSGCRTTP